MEIQDSQHLKSIFHRFTVYVIHKTEFNPIEKAFTYKECLIKFTEKEAIEFCEKGGVLPKELTGADKDVPIYHYRKTII